MVTVKCLEIQANVGTSRNLIKKPWPHNPKEVGFI